ncbi:MAG: type II/IV secretion system protein [Chloroflexi bacterium]|nr:type II/IV secretion system protein [Chloroflexota bacterium]MCI0787977.1 type II/IV secretion system protein [Chloroflexota bacterium]MCI0800391.1 type II/IV secretion system protein [Chloroflexota bacterium]MCI0899395.1 type II/IV secretion system protein [Chloroflexota bacterium]MCI0903058.1 type II/IV secretion system protein [Chloroflexota bacterium]
MIEKIDPDISQETNEDGSNGSYGPGGPVSVEKRVGFARPVSLGQMVTEAGILTAEEVANAQETAWKERLPLGRVLVKEGMVLSTDLATLTALHLGLAMVDLRSEKIDPAAVALISEDVARRYLVLPISRTSNRLTVAMTDPTDLQVLQDLASRTGYTIDPVITTEEDLQEHVDRAYRITAQPLSGVEASEDDIPESRLTAQTLRESGPAQVINLLLHQALQDRASDIHIEPSDSRLRIRFRIDGILHEVMNLPLDMHPTIISRLKIMCGMNIAERRRPQDGQLTFEVMDRSVDVRVAISGTVAGEMSVLRLLDDKKFTLLSLDQLGFRPDSEEAFRKLLRLPYGMVIVCGPTGSGKSTTLYASVLQMNRIENKVISIEDPVEYHMADVNQMQVNPEADITFASQLRSILRLDPDVILVGEIRDQETALIATQAALTGHLVLTTLHANDTVSALIRLKELGVPPYLVASSVAGIVAQRMVRAVCQTCMTLTDRPVAEQQAYAAEMGEEKQRFQYGSGCNACAQTGYVGRIGVFEVLNITDGIRQLFLEDAPRHQLFSKAVDEGIIVLRKDGMIKVQQNLTTPYEVMRVMFSLE